VSQDAYFSKANVYFMSITTLRYSDTYSEVFKSSAHIQNVPSAVPCDTYLFSKVVKKISRETIPLKWSAHAPLPRFFASSWAIKPLA
jgi:hypothetical protein